MDKLIPVIIPAYEPDEKLIDLMDELKKAGISPVVVVNDGSDNKTYGSIFSEVKKRGAVVLTHAVNTSDYCVLHTFRFRLGFRFQDRLLRRLRDGGALRRGDGGGPGRTAAGGQKQKRRRQQKDQGAAAHGFFVHSILPAGLIPRRTVPGIPPGTDRCP